VGAIRWTVIPGLADYHNEVGGALEEGRYLTNEVIDGSVLGEWRQRLRVSPYFPVGTTYADMFMKGRRLAQVDTNEENERIAEHAGVPAFGLAGREPAPAGGAGGEGSDPLTFGTGVVASFLARVLAEPSIEIRTSHRVDEILRDDGGTVVGVRAATPDGTQEIRGPVVLATSTYDWNPELVREFLGLEPDDWGSVAPDTLRGDAIGLVRKIGGAVATIPATSVPILPGWPSQLGTGFGYGPEYAMPHAMIVDRSGRRYCNDSYWVDIVAKTLDPGDRHLPFFLVWDDEHRQKYGLAGTPPGGEYPADWEVVSASTLRELGEKLGIDGAQLEETAKRFSDNARRGEDPDFGRGTVTYVNRFAGDPQHAPSPVLGPIEPPPCHGLRLRFVGTGIGSSGVRIGPEGRVLDEGGARIPGLYAVGSCAALTTTGTGYNSGIALGRGLTLAYLVSRDLSS
jgi:3-oxosteroid 1-dehydrogenase